MRVSHCEDVFSLPSPTVDHVQCDHLPLSTSAPLPLPHQQRVPHTPTAGGGDPLPIERTYVCRTR